MAQLGVLVTAGIGLGKGANGSREGSTSTDNDNRGDRISAIAGALADKATQAKTAAAKAQIGATWSNRRAEAGQLFLGVDQPTQQTHSMVVQISMALPHSNWDKWRRNQQQ